MCVLCVLYLASAVEAVAAARTWVEVRRSWLHAGHACRLSAVHGAEVHPLSVFVGNIPFDVPADDLREFMSTVGTVTHVEMFTRNGMQVGSACVLWWWWWWWWR